MSWVLIGFAIAGGFLLFGVVMQLLFLLIASFIEHPWLTLTAIWVLILMVGPLILPA